MRSARLILTLLPFVFCEVSASQAEGGKPPSLKVSENRRYLVTEKGEPFFWLGDTAWELFHRLNRDEADRYLRKRASQAVGPVVPPGAGQKDGQGAVAGQARIVADRSYDSHRHQHGRP
jgi:hypothetical protein